MTAEILRLPKAEATQPPVEHTITVRSGKNAGFYVNGKRVSLATAAAMIGIMANAVRLMFESGQE